MNRVALVSLACLFCLSISGAEANEWHLIFRDEFKKPELGAEWNVVEGKWKLHGGKLYLQGSALIAFYKALPGLQRIEFIASSDNPGDLSPVLHFDGRKLDSGYFLPFGGYGNTLNKGARLGEPITYEEGHPIEKGKAHHIVAEFDGRNVRLEVDGETVHEYVESKEPLVGENHSRLGIYVDTEGWIEDVRVYSRPSSKDEARPRESGSSLGKGGRTETVEAFGNRLAGGDGEDPEMFIKWRGPVRRDTSDAKSGTACLKLSAIGIARAPDLIDLDSSRCYEISGDFKSAQPNQPSRMLLDVRFLTADKRPIDNWAVHPISEVGTVLSDTMKGETKLRIAGTDWPTRKRPCKLALHAKEDLSDLPNFETLGISNYEVTGTVCEITLSKPLQEGLLAGTKVRLHGYLDYPRVYDNAVPFEWTRYAFRLAEKVQSGEVKGKGAGNYLWPGAKYAQVIILHHYTHYPKPLPAGEPPPVLLFDDITVREIIPTDGAQ